MQAKKMFVRRVCVRVTMGKERNYNSDNSRWFRYAVKFLHHLHDIVEVFDDVITVDFVEIVPRKGIGKPVEIVNEVGLRTGIYIDADCAGAFAKSAPKVENSVRGPGHGSWLVALCLSLFSLFSSLFSLISYL